MQLTHLAAPNDKNGNPQRCFVLSNENGIVVNCWDEGYLGRNAMPEHLRQQPCLLVQVAVKEYKRFLAVAN
jgi:hypothetical protein